MKQCILFSRVSTLRQELESQTNVLVQEANNLGYSSSQQIAIEYKESAISLSMDERKGIQELKEKIENNPNIDCVIVFEISRLSRQTTMLFELRDWLINHKIQLVCCKPYFRLLEDGKLSQTASIVFSLMTSLSENEMIIKKERMLRGRVFKREQCKYIGGRILFGYRIGKDDRIEIDYDDAETVRKIFTWYGEGRSMIWIARELLERGKVNHKWNGIDSAVSAIKAMFRREEYTGKKCQTYNYPRIISDELFQKVSEKITKSKAKTITRKKYLGQGLIRIKKSNLMLSPNANSYTLTRIGLKAEVTLNTKIIEKWLWLICEQRAKTITQDKLQANYLHDVQVLNNKLHTNKLEIEHLNAKIDKINERIVFGKMKEDKGDLMIREIETEIKYLNGIHDTITEKLLSLKPTEVDLSDRKSVVNNEIDVIYVSIVDTDTRYKVRELEVHYKDDTIETYIYKQKAQRIWIFKDDKVILENEKMEIENNFHWIKRIKEKK